MSEEQQKTETEAPTSPFYLVWNERGRAPTRKQPTFKVARAEAQRLARENPGTFFVLAVVATAQLTTLETEHFLFDPTNEAEPHAHDCDCPVCDDDNVPF